MEKLDINDIEPFEVKSITSFTEFQEKMAKFDDWDEDEKVVQNPWAIRVNEDVERASWDHDDDEEEEDEFKPYERRSPEPGDVEYELAESLRIHHSKVEHLSSGQFKKRFWEVKAIKDEEKVASMTPRQRRKEVESICEEISSLKKQVQSHLDKIGVLGQRMAYLICKD